MYIGNDARERHPRVFHPTTHIISS